MKHFKFNILSLLLCTSIMTFTSCNNEVNEENIDSQSNLLRIKTEINTRSVIESDVFANEDQIGVFALKENNDQYASGSSNMKATYLGNNNWNLAKDLPLTKETAIVYAYYPYDSYNESTTININLAYGAKKEIISGQVDYLYGQRAIVNASSPEAQLTFKHALARVTLAVTRSSDDAGSGVISKVSLKNATGKTAISVTGTMDIKTGAIEPYRSESASIELYDSYQLTDVAQNIDILVMPTEINENDAVLELTIDGFLYIVNLPSANWEAGKQYTYPVTIDRKTAHIVQAKIGDYYYSDGSISTEYNSEKDCIGIVFALSKEKDGDIDVTLGSSEHGRIVALQDIGFYSWGPASDVEEIPNVTFLAYDNNIYKRCYLPLNGQSIYSEEASEKFILPYNFSNWPTEKGEYYGLTDYDGRKHTSYIKTEEYPAANACYSCTIGGVNEGFWYLPAIGEFCRLTMAFGIGKVCNEKQSIFTNLQSNGTSLRECYWTSTENYQLYGVYNYNIMTGMANTSNGGSLGANNTKHTASHVRPISSF